jgi:hypothetical protein
VLTCRPTGGTCGRNPEARGDTGIRRCRIQQACWLRRRSDTGTRALRSDLIDPTIAVYNGRIVKRTGDGAIVELRGVVDAVRCAIEVQNAMVERNAGVSPECRIEFRVGIHLGDVVEESDGDLMGDGVNIAFRPLLPELKRDELCAAGPRRAQREHHHEGLTSRRRPSAVLAGRRLRRPSVHFSARAGDKWNR